MDANLFGSALSRHKRFHSYFYCNVVVESDPRRPKRARNLSGRMDEI